MSETNYLKLKYISLMSTRWFQDFNSNLARLDLLGKAVRVQQGAGLSMGLRTELSDGSLVEPIRAVPNSNNGVDLYLGRPNSGDRVIVQAPTGGIGSRVLDTTPVLAFVSQAEATDTAKFGSCNLTAFSGKWDIETFLHVAVRVTNPVSELLIKVEAIATSNSLSDLGGKASFTARIPAGVGVTTHYGTLVVLRKSAPSGIIHQAKLRFIDLNGGITPGDGATVELSVVNTAGENSHILATRVE